MSCDCATHFYGPQHNFRIHNPYPYPYYRRKPYPYAIRIRKYRGYPVIGHCWKLYNVILLYSMQCWQLSTLCQWSRRLYQMFKWILPQRSRPVWRLDIFFQLYSVLYTEYDHVKHAWLNTDVAVVFLLLSIWFLFFRKMSSFMASTLHFQSYGQTYLWHFR